jgi:hypothetical protein
MFFFTTSVFLQSDLHDYRDFPSDLNDDRDFPNGT